jgi:transcriptional regulator with GAF, ATPase, and Fis domain
MEMKPMETIEVSEIGSVPEITPGIETETMGLAVASIDAHSLAGVLSEIAETASETLELQEVFDRVATSVRKLIPFEDMGVVRVFEGERATVPATTVVACRAHDPDSWQSRPLTDWSPRIRPRPRSNRIDDARRELDGTFPMDSCILSAGVGSTLWEPFRVGGPFRGGVWLSARSSFAFTDEHQEALRPIAALLGTAVEHWGLWDAERRRRARLDRTEALLGTLAESLDVREVFQRLSDEMKPILPHDMMTLTEVDVRARTIQLTAIAGASDIPPPSDAVPMTDQELRQRVDFEIIDDIATRISPETERQRRIASSGMRSWLRVPVLLSGEVQGGLNFFHREPSRYNGEDAEVARRLADRIALTLSLRRLAEEARAAAEARERAERLEATVETLAHEVAIRGRGRIIGVSPSWKEALLAVGRVASSETTVLITGESGTGKEVISNLIHRGSSREDKPFVAINCAALPEQLLESELFGHEKGAFTGAIAAKIGRIEQAAGGTLFLDEIAEMSPAVQAKFLRVLEEREFQRVGGTRTLKADVRVIAATNRDLATAIARQAFREDLFYRLNVFQIHIPPLRERPEDILPLAEAFLEDLGKTMGRPAAGISRDAREWLLTYPWPGNVRELRNAIERAILLCDGGLITHDHLPTPVTRLDLAPAPAANGHIEPAGPTLTNGLNPNTNGLNLEVMERGLVERALGQTSGNKSKAARILGLTRAQLYTRLERYGIQ